MSRPTILLNPGPVNLTPRVRAALSGEDECHREPEFADLTRGTLAALERVHPEAAASHAARLVTGSGTTAVEAMLASLVPRDGTVLVAANGVYGERIERMLAAQGKASVLHRGDWLAPLDPQALGGILRERPEITHVATVHSETTTGRLNDLGPVAELCASMEKGLLVDAVSSFGAEAVDFEAWRPLGVAATANKCLHGAPGISFVLAERSALAGCAGNSPALVLDLAAYADQAGSGFSPFTQATHVLRALREALRELDEQGGWSQRRERYRFLSARIREGLVELGVEPLLEAGASSSMITAFRLPRGRTYGELHDALREAGFVIYAGQGELSKTLFRIANMGAIQDDDVRRLLDAFRGALA